MFDIDGTLAVSKQAIEPSMAELLQTLLSRTNVAIISGGKLEQFLKQIVERLPENSDLGRLYLLPTSGAALYRYDQGAWRPIYEEMLSPEEAARIEDALMTAIERTGTIDLRDTAHGERIEYRGAQVTLSALGQEAPIAEKDVWDPDQQKRRAIVAIAALLLPGFDVKMGGTTSIDITKHGVNKAYGVRKLSAYLDIPIADMVYVGDALYPGGNDEVVKETGIPTLKTKNPSETEALIQDLLQSSE